MKYKNLGRTGLKVTELCLGAMPFGAQVEERTAIGLINSAFDAGINFLDTADLYAEGKSEEIVGKALRGKRHSVVLATKVGNRTGPGINNAGASRQHIMEALETSLRRLQTDYVDIYYIHQPDYETPIAETLRTLDNLVRQGKVRYIGCSNFRAWFLCKALWTSDVRHLARFDCTQPPYNLITRDSDSELLPLCSSEGIGVCVYNPLAGGLLSGKYNPTLAPPEGTRFSLPFATPLNKTLGQVYRERYWSSANFRAIERFRKLAVEHGCSLAQFALAWVLSRKEITSAICGVTSQEQLTENLRVTEITLSKSELAACDDAYSELK